MGIANLIMRFFGALWRTLNGLRKVLHLLLLVFLFLVFLGVVSRESPELVPQRAALVIAPVGELVEEFAGDPYDLAIAEMLGNSTPQTLLQDIVDALAFAADDKRIQAVHLELSSLGSAGLSKLQRVAEAIDEFRESGKPVIASADYYSQQAYFLAAHADEVYLHPEGIVFLQGYGAFRTYYKDAIDLLRIDWNVFRVGTHKSAVEPYTRMDMSPEDRETRQRLVDQLWALYRQDVEGARELEDGALDDYTTNLVAHASAAGGDLAIAARDFGLVDDLLGRGELVDVLKEYAGADKDDETMYAAVGMDAYLSQANLLHARYDHEDTVAIVVASGTILNGSQPPGTIGGDSTAALLREARTDDSVKAVVLRVDSPGGSAFASEVIAQEVMALQAAGKPVVASMSSVAASGGYWISVAADRVIASPATITGSIGVIGMFPTYQRTLGAVGIATDGVGTTPWSGELRGDREMSEHTKQLFQLVINQEYEQFVGNVAAHRNLDPDYVDSVAQGQVWIGNDALDKGLIDELGTLEDAIRIAAELAGLGEDAYREEYIEQRMTPTQQLILDLLAITERFGIVPASLAKPENALVVFADKLQAFASFVGRFNDPKGVYSHCLCELD